MLTKVGEKMVRRYCDCCGEEITDKNRVGDAHWRLTAKIEPKKNSRSCKSLIVEVITAKDGAWNDGDFCKYCIIDAINKLDDRPKECEEQYV